MSSFLLNAALVTLLAELTGVSGEFNLSAFTIEGEIAFLLVKINKLILVI
jgi:hypothetical protein